MILTRDQRPAAMGWESRNPSSSGMAHLLPDELQRCPKVPFVHKKYLFVYLGAFGLEYSCFYLQQGSRMEKRNVWWGWRELGCENCLLLQGRSLTVLPGLSRDGDLFLSSFSGRLQAV